MNIWLVVVAAGAGSYLFRISMLVLVARVGLPSVLGRAARVAVPTAFAALATTSLMGSVTTDMASVAPLAAVVVAALAVRATGSPRAALLAGMPTLWVLGALLPA